MRRNLSFFLAVLVFCMVFSGCSKPGELTVYDAKGEVLVSAVEEEELSAHAQAAYLEIVTAEATAIIAELEGCSQKDAKKMLFGKNSYTVYTAFDGDVATALEQVYQDSNPQLAIGGAVTDLNGNLLAVYSSQETNYAHTATSPYSTFKPLSVYAPAIEKGLVNWSSTFEDSAYKKVDDGSGNLVNWPANATGTYSMKPETVYDAVKNSLNTVAVKCLADLGVNNSIAFLQESFGIPLSTEQYCAEVYGEEEIIGNIALGYLKDGVTPVDMAGYYQVFATGGVYEKPQTITKICDASGKVLYERSYEKKQVISAATADIMNKILQGVVSGGGTGEAAWCKNIEVAGKTGTGENDAGNWFVGVTPGYSCAIWHGNNSSNCASEMFSAVVEAIYKAKPESGRIFAEHAELKEVVYCRESGMAISGKCTIIELGNYASDDALATCDIHN